MKGDMQRIRETYGVPAKKGGRVVILNEDGSHTGGFITGARDGNIRIRLAGENYSQNYHPLLVLEYLPEGAK